MQITLNLADCSGNQKNCVYPHRRTVSSAKDFARLVTYDHMFAVMKGNRRSISNFLETSFLAIDIDNDHSEDPAAWFRPEDIPVIFAGVPCVTYTSRNHNKQKGQKSARPRFHVVFPIRTVKSAEAYSALVQRLANTFQCIDMNAIDPARFFFGTPHAEVRFYPGSRALEAFLEEAEQDAALLSDNALPGVSGTGIIPEGSRNGTLHRTALRLLKRYGETEQAKALFRETAGRCSPPLPEAELDSIWKSALKYYNTVFRMDADYLPPGRYRTEQPAIPADTVPTVQQPKWETPVSLEAPPVPEFPIGALPPVVANYVCAVSESIQAPLGMVATSVLSIFALCLQGKYKVRAKQGWTEPVNLFTFNVLNASERKSAVLNTIAEPVLQFERKYNQEHAGDVERSRMTRSILEKRKKTLEDQAAKGMATQEELQNVIDELLQHRDLKPLRLFSDNITVEKLGAVMAENDGRAAILSTEPGIFDNLDGAYSDTVNIDTVLKAYSGDPIRVERIGRDSDFIDQPLLTANLMGQPVVLESLMSSKKLKNRGLTSRFLYCCPDSLVGNRRYQTRETPPEVNLAYEDLIQNLLTDPYPDTPDRTPVITLSPEASQLHQAFYEEMELQQGTELKNYPDMKEWAGKLSGNVLRIAGLLSRIQADIPYPSLANPFTGPVFEGDDTDVFGRCASVLEVDRTTMECAVEICRYYLAHARKAFSLMGADRLTLESRYVRDAILEKGLREFSSREILRECRRFKSKAEILPILQHLEDFGYLIPKETEYSGKGRPHADAWVVNPLLFQESGCAA